MASIAEAKTANLQDLMALTSSGTLALRILTSDPLTISTPGGDEAIPVVIVSPEADKIGEETVSFAADLPLKDIPYWVWDDPAVEFPKFDPPGTVTVTSSDPVADANSRVLIQGLTQGGEIVSELLPLGAASANLYFAPLYLMGLAFRDAAPNPTTEGEEASAFGDLTAQINGSIAGKIKAGDMVSRSSCRIVPPGEVWRLEQHTIATKTGEGKPPIVSLYAARPGSVAWRLIQLPITPDSNFTANSRGSDQPPGTILYLKATAQTNGDHVTGSLCWSRRMFTP